MKTITCKLPEKLDAELAAVAREEGTSKSRIVRSAIADRVGKKRGKMAPRAYDLISDIAGSVKGPGDLSTNPGYMENFGA